MIRTGAREKSALCPARARLFGRSSAEGAPSGVSAVSLTSKRGHLRCPPFVAESMIRTGAREKSALCPARARLFGLLISHTTAFRPHRHTISSAKNKRAPIRPALFFADAGKAALLNFFRRNRGRALRKEPKPCYNTVKANEGGRIWQEGSYT